MDALSLPDGPDSLSRRTTRESHISGRSGNFSRIVSQSSNVPPKGLNMKDIDERFQVEEEDDLSNVVSPSISSNDFHNAAPPNKTIIHFEPHDPDHAYNWPVSKKFFTLSVSIITVMNSTISSSLVSNAAPYIARYWHITSPYLLVLPTSMFLVGYVVGPILWGPLSESFGRKPIMLSAFSGFTVCTMASALSPNFAALVAFRLFTGIAAACPIAVVGGTCADVFGSPVSRGRAMAFFMAATTWGPCGGPIISGFISVVNWRWSLWVGLIFAGVTWIPLILVPETYAPIILKRRARKMRKEGKEDVLAAIELEKADMAHVVAVVLTRPIRMLCFEPLVLFSCLYLSFAYGIFYLFLVAYEFIYEDIYGFTTGEEGLAFVAIGIGAIIACLMYFGWDTVLRRAYARDTWWSRREEFRRLPLACAAGPFFILSCFWLAWTARKDIHWIVPVISGVPFGIGYLLLFMALLNYLVDAYKIFAASSMAAASCSRSLFGAVLPFAAYPMYKNLGVPWACSTLGFLSIAMSIIPFAFIWKGDWLRKKSKFCQYLAERERKEQEEEEQEHKARQQRLNGGREELREQDGSTERYADSKDGIRRQEKEKDMV